MKETINVGVIGSSGGSAFRKAYSLVKGVLPVRFFVVVDRKCGFLWIFV